MCTGYLPPTSISFIFVGSKRETHLELEKYHFLSLKISGLVMARWSGPGPARTDLKIVMGRAGPGRAGCFEDMMDRAGSGREL